MKKIKNNTDYFDDFEPLEGHKVRFQSRLDRDLHRKQRPYSWLKVAASILVLFALSLSLYKVFPPKESETTASSEKTKEALPLETAENYYEQSFNEQFTAIAKNYKDAESIAMIEKSEVLIQELREEYKLLEKELKLTGDKRVAAAMILNYKSRIEILEQLMKKLEYVNQMKTQKNEKINA